MNDLGEPLVDIRGLSVDFQTPRGRVQALRDICFAVPKGRILGIVGESGSGKSTVLWSLLGLLAGNADVESGEIAFAGRNLLALSEEELRAIRGEEVSVVFQDPMTSQVPVLTYGQQMLDILYRRRKMPVAEKRRAAVDMLRRVGIPDPAARMRQYPHHFSGGMRQRAGIAMALLTDPALLLADEPTTALDVTMEAQVIRMLRDLQAELAATIVVVSHNLGLIAELCDEVVVMYAGEVVETGAVRDIFHHAQHPYTRALLECDPARVLERSRHLPVIPGEVPDVTQPPPGCIFASRCPRVMDICHRVKPADSRGRGATLARCHLVEGPHADPGWPPAPGVATADTDAEVGAAAPVPVPVPATARAADVTPAAPLLEVENLHVRFHTASRLFARLRGAKAAYVDAVLDVSLGVRPGETLGIVGESGSGKTTTGRAILNLTRSQTGSVRFAGEEIRGLPEQRFKARRRDMAMMFQDPNGSLSPRESVRSLITEPFTIHGETGRDLTEEAERLSDLVRFPRAFLSRYPHELSGGQARRVGVARALALEPKLVIADEPTAGLDVSVQGEILNLMSDLQQARGLGYIIITHNLPVVRHISDRLAIMYLGRIVEQGDCEQIFRDPAHPYTHALISGIPQPDPDRRRETLALEGEVPSPSNRPSGCEFRTRCPFAQARCAAEEPETRVLDNGRTVRCHFPFSARP